MSEEAIHYWCSSPSLWRRVQAAAKAERVLTAEWVQRAVIERLERTEVSPCRHTVFPGQGCLL